MREAARTLGLEIEVRRFAAGTATAADAARQIGCKLGAIVKSVIFLSEVGPIVALCCGDDRVSEQRLAELFGVPSVRRATADDVKRITGYPIGGVPPFGHASTCKLAFDENFARFDTIWAAAGLPDAVFSVDAAWLRDYAGGPATIAIAEPLHRP